MVRDDYCVLPTQAGPVTMLDEFRSPHSYGLVLTAEPAQFADDRLIPLERKPCLKMSRLPHERVRRSCVE